MPHPMIPVAPPRLRNEVFTEAEVASLFSVLRAKGPWKTILGLYFNNVEELLAVSSRDGAAGRKAQLTDFLTPAFRGFFGNNGLVFHDEVHEIFYSRKLLGLVKAMHGAQYGAPYLFQFNLQGPSHGSDPGHFDGRSWRGMDPTNTPAWLMSVMAKSGLFDRWEIKAGQVVTYFYDSDQDGGFTYWPDGPDQSPRRFAAPFWNAGIVSDNQRMFHRGEGIGARDQRDPPAGLALQSVVEADDADGWKVTTDGRVVARFARTDTRILFHYSAHVFADMAELKQYFDHTDDLNRDQAFQMLIDDLKRRGVAFELPTDPLRDPAFVATLTQAYAMAPTSYPPEAPVYVPQRSAA